VRKPDSPTAVAIAALANVELVTGDFDNEESVESALKGVSRALLVSGAGQHEQFDRETFFIAAAERAGLEFVVRVSTASVLIHPGSTGVYARAHAGIEAFIEYNNSPVIDLNPNWFFDNILSSAGEAKATGQITYPIDGSAQSAFIDPRDVGRAAGHILLLSLDAAAPLLAQRKIEVHGPALTSLNEQLEVLSAVVGYPIKINKIDGDAWANILIGYGASKLFARSFLATIQILGGERKPTRPPVQVTSEVLTSTGWAPKYDIHAWAQSEHVLAAFKKNE